MKLNAILFSLLIIFSTATLAHGFLAEESAPLDFPAEVFVYPNPSTGLFFVELQSSNLYQAELKVVSLIGKTVIEQTIEANYRVQLDLTDQPKGIYFVQLKAGKETYLKRVVIQ